MSRKKHQKRERITDQLSGPAWEDDWSDQLEAPRKANRYEKKKKFKSKERDDLDWDDDDFDAQ